MSNTRSPRFTAASAIPSIAPAAADVAWHSKTIRPFAGLARIGMLFLLLAQRASGESEYQESKACDSRQLR
jgi:hypothetical protein